ncbi:zinc knuckle CX2CX4HX4C containing protein [Tanacetum coccineum]
MNPTSDHGVYVAESSVPSKAANFAPTRVSTSLFDQNSGGNMFVAATQDVPIAQIAHIISKSGSYAGAAERALDKIESGALDDVIYVLTTTECEAAHALVLELARGFDYVNSDSDTSSEEPNRVTPGVVSHIDESLIVQYVSIQDKPSSYIGAAGLWSATLVITWGKYGLTRIMMNFKSFFFFKFNTSKSLEDVLENGPWMIRNTPIILKKWSMNTRLCKEELTCIPVWVKIHDVPLQVFSEDGISIIASQLESLTMGVPLIEDSGFSIETVRIKYEWKPPRCDLCMVFGHVHDQSPKKVTVTSIAEKTNDEFQMVASKKKNGKAKSVNSGKSGDQSVKQSVRYEPKAATNVPKTGVPNMVNSSKSGSSHVSPMPKIQPLKANVPPVSSRRSLNVVKGGNITVSNSYASLDDESEEEVENVFDESANLLNSTKTGASSSTYNVVLYGCFLFSFQLVIISRVVSFYDMS